MLSRLFLFIINISPNIKKIAWYHRYQILAKKYNKNDWTFMNYGYTNSTIVKRISLMPEDLENRLLIQLYHHVASKVPIKEKKVLEIGSGRGGGAGYITKYLNPNSMVGVDISDNAVQFCKKTHKINKLDFKIGDAENLPFENNLFDTAINVESSHCYGNFSLFLNEVHRVLIPNGYLSLCDLRSKEAAIEMEQQLEASNFKIIKKEIITESVLLALDEISDRKSSTIKTNVPVWIRNSFMDFAGAKGTRIYNGFKSGEIMYLSYVLQK